MSSGRTSAHDAPFESTIARGSVATLLTWSAERAASVLVVLIWLRLMANLVVLSFTADKRFVQVGAEAASSAAADLAGRLFLGLSLLWAAGVIVYRLNQLPMVGLWRIAVFLAPWTVLLFRDAYDGRIGASAVPLVFYVLALAALRPGRATLEVLGYLVVITSLIAVVWGFLLPEAAILRESDGSVRDAAKALVPSMGLLQGQFTSENNLAQYVALGLPFVLLIGRKWVKVAGLGACALAIAWSSSRGGLITAAVVLGLAGVFYLLGNRRRLIAGVSAATAMVVAAVAAWLPLLPWQDDAFTARGGIWRVSAHHWVTEANLFGHGTGWFEEMAKNATSSLNSAAYHAHNQFLQLGVTGGVTLLIATAVWLAVIAAVSLRPSSPLQSTAALLICAILVSGFFEVPLGFVDRWSFWAVSLVPLAILFFAPPRVSSTPLDLWRRP